VLAEIETDKATVEVESNFDGTVAKHLVEKGAIVPVNSPIAIIANPGEDVQELIKSFGEPAAAPVKPAAVEEKTVPQPTPAETPEGAHLPAEVRASPLARRMAAAVGLNLSEVPGSGPGGRITKQDIEEYLSAPAKGSGKPEQTISALPAVTIAPENREKTGKAAVQLSPLTATAISGDRTVQPSRLRLAIGRRMVESKQQVPHFYVTHEYEVDALIQLRKQLNEFLPDDEKISVNDFIIKAVALTLRQFPNLNAALRDKQVVQFGAINIGVAVAVEGGLLTVVCRDADRKPIRQISAEIKSMAGKAREGKVRPEDIEGSTFSISNLGMYDVENFAAIINPPEAAILAVGSARQIPVVRDNQVEIAWRMKATISVDHRVSDGAEGARFMQALALYLQNPVLLLL
jgi:pyruvate dehydrogenase E2 component (dihydrolipoamide acetyltransferase)